MVGWKVSLSVGELHPSTNQLPNQCTNQPTNTPSLSFFPPSLSIPSAQTIQSAAAKTLPSKPTNQTDRPTSQPTKHPTDQRPNHLAKQPTNQPTNPTNQLGLNPSTTNQPATNPFMLHQRNAQPD